MLNNKEDLKVHITLLLIVTMVFVGCSMMPTVEHGASAELVSQKIGTEDREGDALVYSPEVKVEGRGNYYYLNMYAEYGRAIWSIRHSNQKDFGNKVQCFISGRPVNVKKTKQYVLGQPDINFFLYEVSLSSMDLKEGSEKGLNCRFTGRESSEFTIWPEMLEAFYKKAQPLAAKWEAPSGELTQTLVAHTKVRLDYSIDDFKKIKWASTPKRMTDWPNVHYVLTKGIFENSDSSTLYLRIYSNNSDWAFYDHAYDSSGVRHEVSVDREVGHAGHTYETIDIHFKDSEVSQFSEKGVGFKIYGKRGSFDFYVPGYLFKTLMEL